MFRFVLCSFTVLYISVVSAEEVFFSDTKRAVEFEITDGKKQECSMHGDSKYIKKLFMDKDVGVNVVSSQEMEVIIRECEHFNRHLSNEEHQKRISRKKRFVVYAGTKWCGSGNIASSYDDLGEAVQTDTCCREHDQCDTSIAPLSSQYGLTNYALYYKSHCSCDDAFNACLKTVQNEAAAEGVGNTYFNLFAVDCIRETGNTARVCVQRRWFRCRRYETQTEMEYRAALPF